MQKTGEYNSNNAFIYNGNTGNVNNNNKYNTNAVRPVSEFQGNVDPFASFYKSMRAAYRLCLKTKRIPLTRYAFGSMKKASLLRSPARYSTANTSRGNP